MANNERGYTIQETLATISDLVHYKKTTIEKLNNSSYSCFRHIIIFKDNIDESGIHQKLETIDSDLKKFISEMKARVPEALKMLNLSKDMSKATKSQQKTEIKSTDGINEILGILESIALELQREETTDPLKESLLKQEMNQVADELRGTGKELKGLINFLNGPPEPEVEEVYTLGGYNVAIALSVFISFVLSLNFSLLTVEGKSYLEYFGNSNASYVFGPLLPAFAIPAYIILHFSAKANLRRCLLFSMFFSIIGNILYFIARDVDIFAFFIIGRAIMGIGLPGLALKQFIGFHVKPEERARVSVMYTTASFIGISCGYFLGLAFEGSSSDILGMELSEVTMGGFFLGVTWILTFLLSGTLFLNPEKTYPADDSNKGSVKGLLVLSFLLPSLLREGFVSPGAIPSDLNWSDGAIYAYIGVFTLMMAPISFLVYAAAHITEEKILLVFSKVFSLVGCSFILLGQDTPFWFVIGSILLLVGVNVGAGISFSLLSKTIRNDLIGMIGSVIELGGLVIGYSLGHYGGFIAQLVLFFLLAASLIGDVIKFKTLDHTKIKHKKDKKDKKDKKEKKDKKGA